MNVTFEIISRGSIRIIMCEKIAVAQGELTFNPPVFYIDSSSLKKWTMPNGEKISNDDLALIKEASIDSETGGTKIIFD